MTDERRDVRAVVRTYKGDDGKDKNVYQTIGSAWVSEHASTITVQIETLPISKDWNGKLFINKPYEKKGEYDKDIETVKAIGEAKKDNLPSDDEADQPIDLYKLDVPF